MVATRRGTRVNSPSERNQGNTPAVQATPSTGPRTRSAAKQVESCTQQSFEESCSPLQTNEGGHLVTPATSTTKRCTRASRFHSPKLPSTPAGSVHEADVSDVESVVESVCSAVSNTEGILTRTSRRRRPTRARNQENEEISEVESCSSAVSASKPERRSTRRRTAPHRSDSAQTVGDVKASAVTESCSSATSESRRVTRSQRKTASTRSSAKCQPEDSESSDADSCTSSVLGRASRRQMGPIPIHLDELSESSRSPQTSRRTRAGRRKTAASDVSEPPSCDSEGFESGPSCSLSLQTESRAQSTDRKAVDSDSELMEVNSSPRSTRSSRAGPGTGSRGAPASRRSERKCGGVVKSVESAEEDALLNDSRLESTLLEGDAEATLLEEAEIQTSEESVRKTDLDSSETDTKTEEEENSQETVSEPAVITKDQKEEPSAENKDEDASEMEVMQETVPPSEQIQACQSDTATNCVRVSEMTEEEAVGAAAEALLGVEEEQASTEVQQVVQVQTEAQPSNQQHHITEDSDSEQQPKDVQSRKAISLLDSSDDDDEDEEESEVPEEDEERRGEPSRKSGAAVPSVSGLFMIDTCPGEDADQRFYREEEEASSQRPEEDPFVDEEEDSNDDEDTQILLSSRSSHLKELSSRIDPGIRVKELGGLYITFDGSKSKPISSSLQKLKEKKKQDEMMKKSVIGPDFEKKDAVPPYSESKQALKLKHRAEREKTAGDGWFNMKAPELTQELKGDLKVLKMRGSLDPKRFYKKNDRDGFPKYFQIGTVVDNPVDFYHSRIPKKERKRTMVEELLADAEFRHKNKKKYQQIVAEKAAQAAGKRNKKKKFPKKT